MKAYTTSGLDDAKPYQFCDAIVAEIHSEFSWDLSREQFGQFLAVLIRHDGEGFGPHIPWQRKRKLKESNPTYIQEIATHKMRSQGLIEHFQHTSTAIMQSRTEVDLLCLGSAFEEIGKSSCLVLNSYNQLRIGLVEAGRRGDSSWMTYVSKPLLMIESYFESR